MPKSESHGDGPMNERVQYLTVGEMRREIADAVGSAPDRFGPGSDRCLRKRTVVKVAIAVTDGHVDPRLMDRDLSGLYDYVADEVGLTYQHTAGRDWGFPREVLKRIHAEVVAS